MAKQLNAGVLKQKSGMSNPTPSVSAVPKAMPRTLDAANAIDNLNIPKGKKKK